MTFNNPVLRSLKADFDELRERVRHGRELGHASFEPIYYLVFDPSRIIEVKRQTRSLVAGLKNDGWTVSTFSIAENIALGREPGSGLTVDRRQALRDLMRG